jgi:hypothetical protein
MAFDRHPAQVLAQLTHSDHFSRPAPRDTLRSMSWVRAHPIRTVVIVLGILVALYAVQFALWSLGGSTPGNGRGDIIESP